MSHKPRNAGAKESDEFIETQRILFELWKRDESLHREGLPYHEHLEQKARRKAWNPNPACTYCGSYAHFECGSDLRN